MIDTDYPSLSPLQLSAAGQALFGATWRADLARAFGISETEIVMVESGRAAAPKEWRAKLVALAQDTALRALEAASDLLWREAEPVAEPAALYAPRFA